MLIEKLLKFISSLAFLGLVTAFLYINVIIIGMNMVSYLAEEIPSKSSFKYQLF